MFDSQPLTWGNSTETYAYYWVNQTEPFGQGGGAIENGRKKATALENFKTSTFVQPEQ